MPTLAHILDFVPIGGRASDDFLISHGEALRLRGWRVVYVFTGAPQSSIAASLSKVGAVWLVAPSKPSVTQSLAIGRELRKYRPRILEAWFMSKFHPNLLALKVSSGARYLILADHSSGAVRRKKFVGRMLNRVRGAVAGLYTDRFITVSDYIRHRDVFDLRLPAHKMRLVYDGIDLARFSLSGRAANANGRPTLAFAGQLIPEKGVTTLLAAVEQLKKGGLSPLLRIAGSGPAELALREFCADRDLVDNVEFLGQIDWVPDLFKQADAVVVPSQWEEAFGYVVAEAMASGACVVAADVGGIGEVVGKSGEAGLLFRKGDSSDLAAKIRFILSLDEHGRAAIGSAARERIERLFSIERMVNGYLDVYEELVPPSRRREDFILGARMGG